MTPVPSALARGGPQAAQAWWRSRSGREQVMLAVMAVFVAAFLGWFGLVAPLMSAADRAREHASLATRQSAQLASLAAGHTARRRAGAQPAQPLAAIVEPAAAAAGVSVDRRRQDGDGRLTIWSGAADSRLLMAMIVALEPQGVEVVDFSAVRAEGGGLETQVTFAQAVP